MKKDCMINPLEGGDSERVMAILANAFVDNHEVSGLVVTKQQSETIQNCLLTLIEDPFHREKLAGLAPDLMKPNILELIIGRWEILINSFIEANGVNLNINE